MVVTYAVGGLSLVNAVAEAFAEKIPLIIISGGPALDDYDVQPQQHHTLGDYAIPLDIFKKITVASACILNPERASIIIDALLLKCIQYKQPVYLEIPCDIVNYPCLPPGNFVVTPYSHHDNKDVQKAVEATLALFRNAVNPIVIVGHEIQRYSLRPLLEELLLNSGLPFSTFVTDKTTLSEEHPQFIGSCGLGIHMAEDVKKYIEYSDCLLCLGSIMASHLSSFMSDLNVDKQISAFDHQVHIKKEKYAVSLHSFITALNEYFKNSVKKRTFNINHMQLTNMQACTELSDYQPEKKITHDRLIKRIGGLLKDDDILIAAGIKSWRQGSARE